MVILTDSFSLPLVILKFQDNISFFEQIVDRHSH